jgi:hypothetical protein
MLIERINFVGGFKRALDIEGRDSVDVSISLVVAFHAPPLSMFGEGRIVVQVRIIIDFWTLDRLFVFNFTLKLLCHDKIYFIF